MRCPSPVVTLVLVWLNCGFAVAQDAANSLAFQKFIERQGALLRTGDKPPSSIGEWKLRRSQLREHLVKAWGGFPETDCPLEPRVLGEFHRDGYRIEKIVFQTRPGVFMTANAYVPEKPGKLAAILHVHGHWAGAKQDPVVQSRCIGCAKLGFFVLSVDAFGAGERGVDTKLGEYHGEMTAATLIPVGLPLSGLQVYENKRAVDYLMTRPEVDPQRIGITGASGGGNQTMYAGAFDERLRCVVPTCSVGNYQAYLRAACCQCEVVPGALVFTEEGDVLGLAADRGLMVTSATQDAFQFSVNEARKSFSRVEAIAKLFSGAKVRHTIIESPHAYNQPMREAMYGWMALNLKQEGDGSPIADPVIQPEDPELLKCYPGNSRPEDFVTIPKFAQTEAQQLAKHRTLPTTREQWRNARKAKHQAFIERLGGLPTPSPITCKIDNDADGTNQTLTFETEPGLEIYTRRDLPEQPGRLAVLIDIDHGAQQAWNSALARELREAGWAVVTPELRATGEFAYPRDAVGQAPDHNSAEWSLWIGRPLLGQWVHDIRRTLDAIAQRDGSLPHDILVIGQGSSGVVALSAAALDERFTRVKTINTLTTFVTSQPYREWRLGLMVPGILRDVGDIPDIAGLVAPRAVTIQGGATGIGTSVPREHLDTEFEVTKRVFELHDSPGNLLVIP